MLDYDPVQAEMVGQVGASPVPTDIVNAPNMFNNGVVDVLAAPLAAYEIVELYKGMTPTAASSTTRSRRSACSWWPAATASPTKRPS